MRLSQEGICVQTPTLSQQVRQMKTGNIAAGNDETTTTTLSSIRMQTGNNGGNTGTECNVLAQFDPTTALAVPQIR